MSCNEGKSSSLRDLAAQRFQNLTDAEEKLLLGAANGTPACCGPAGTGPNDPKNALARACTWGRSREIRADLILWLCGDQDANKLVHSKGVTVACAKVSGILDISALAVRFPLIFFQCCLCSDLRALYSSLLFLSLERCVVRPGATGGIAMLADSVHARAFNLRRTVFNGEVNLRAAEIDNNFECDGARFINPAGIALSVNSARISGSVFLRNGFTSEGEVNLCGASIGSLDCTSATLRSASGRTLAVDDARIERKVDLRDAKATGTVSFVAAEIGSDLGLDGADFTGATLRLERARIKGSLFARRTRFGHNGFLDLSGAFAESIDDDPQSWPSANNVDVDGFTYNYLRRPDEALRRLELLARQPMSGSNGSKQRVHAQPYRHLARVLRDMGYERESRATLVALERERDRREKFSATQKFLRSLYRIALRYGYEPHKPSIAIAILIFAIGWILVSLGTSAGLMAPMPESVTAKAPRSVPSNQLSPMLYSLDTLLPIHAFNQEANWWPRAEAWRWCLCWPVRLPWGYFLRLWLSLEIVAGWLLTGVIVAGLTGIVRRE